MVDYLLVGNGTSIEGYNKDELEVTFPLNRIAYDWYDIPQVHTCKKSCITLCYVGGTRYVVMVDQNILWWYSLIKEGHCVRMGESQKRKLNYKPSSVVSDDNGQLLMADKANNCLYKYNGDSVFTSVGKFVFVKKMQCN